MPYTLTVHDSINAIKADEWDNLRANDQPFSSHAFLAGLENSGSLREELGWVPFPITLHLNEQLVGAAPAYLKNNSHGEFVFDWAWAEAHERNQIRYYPKLLVGIPYSPVPGPRLLVGSGPQAHAHRRALVSGIAQLVEQHQLSSAHVNFLLSDDAAAFAQDPWLIRGDVQFHWHNRGYSDFDEFLAAMEQKKRKNIRAERRAVAAAGVEIKILHGDQIDTALWDQLHALYCRTFDQKHNTPALTRGFFEHMGATLGGGIVAVTAWKQDRMIAMALCLRDRDTLYGRYWGCLEEIRGLHFECCYYQGIAYCLREGIEHFQPGAQGEHKLARGFLPVATRSAHFIRLPPFRQAIRVAINSEHVGLAKYRKELLERSPFKSDPPEAESTGSSA